MINNKKVLALIPARGGSKGLPGKNILELNGKPLVGWPIQAAKRSCYVDKVVVSTDDKLIADKARDLGAEVPFMRPEELASDTASTIAVIEHAINFLQEKGETFDYIILLEPTSPLTEPEDVDYALDMLIKQRDIADSVVGVSLVINAHPLFDVTINEKGLIVPYSEENFLLLGRRQDLSELYYFDGSVYISDVSILLQKNSFYHQRTLAYKMPKWKSFEVDDIVDFICIEAIMENIERIRGDIANERNGSLDKS